MVGQNPTDGMKRSQETVSVMDVGYVPATVHAHDHGRVNGMQVLELLTRDPDHDSDIIVYPDDTPPHRRGDPHDSEEAA